MAKRKATKTRAKVARAFHEVKHNPPKTLRAKGKNRRKQVIAVALNKARRAGARIPKKKGKKR
jgi:hypothetical protein